jgi:hypothetical protein
VELGLSIERKTFTKLLGDSRKVCTEKLHKLYFSPDIIRALYHVLVNGGFSTYRHTVE